MSVVVAQDAESHLHGCILLPGRCISRPSELLRIDCARQHRAARESVAVQRSGQGYQAQSRQMRSSFRHYISCWGWRAFALGH
eukprot:5692412-Prymnesium_polylepis.2